MWPQIIVIVLASIGLGVHAVKCGEPISGRYDPVSRLVGIGVSFSLLYWGGFFDPMFD
jgi:prepilin signal peptidase PulO-like enzyme (type II secretory pathway)